MPLTPLTFRIFVSSTFADLKEERNALHRTVFPALKALCENHGARFQAIDLRWGIRDEAALDHQTMRICLDEVRRCQEVTPKPNFLILLGDRYGWRPLPAEIPAAEWHAIAAHLRAAGQAADLERLEQWYTFDANALAMNDPAGAWVLHSRSREERGTDRFEDPGIWEAEVERPLRVILERAAAALPLADAERLKYGASATEQEISRGALTIPDAQEHVFCFLRTIAGLPEDATAADYRDLVSEAATATTAGPARLVVDRESDARLDRLRGPDGRLAAALPREHIFRYDAEWRPLPESLAADEWTAIVDRLAADAEAARERDDPAAATGLDRLRALVGEWYEATADHSRRLSGRVQSLDRDERIDLERRLRRAVFDASRPPMSTRHLEPLCADVERMLTGVIRREIARAASARGLSTDVEDEVAAHDQFARDRLRSRRDPARSIFVGRAAALARIASYLSGSDARPLALSGEPGSGKSALIAQAVEQARQRYPNAVVAVRFIGWTPPSTVVRELIDKLCRHLARAYGREEATPSDYRELVQELPKRLAYATASQPLIVFLDAVDQLADADHARNLIWLPLELPPHVRLVVSTSTEPGDTHAVLARRLPDECRFSLDDMPVEEANQLLGHWFDDVDRSLTGRGRSAATAGDQWRHVLDAYQGCQRPLYLKLAFEEARRWRSFDARDKTPLPPTIPQLVHQLFDRLSRPASHGPTLVASSLGSLMASRHGLTEDELIQVLSRDPALLAEVIKYHRPPEERLPVVIWSRLFFDLQPYLTQRRADETSVFAFYHRQLEAVARVRYLQPVKALRHRALAAFFGEQALFLGDTRTPNLRKLSELPYQQTLAGDMWEELHATLTDFDFLEAKCTHVAVTTEGSGADARKVYGGVYELQEDYRLALEHLPAD